jgi:dienelactone hydrolase
MRKLLNALTVIAVAALAVWVPGAPAAAEPAGVTKTDVSFTGAGGIRLQGTVVAPVAGTGPRPGMVMLEGAGNRGRGYLMGDAEEYARHGVVVLVYDKRKEGYSLVRRDYSLLADDALAGVRLLRTRPGVDPAHTGLWGLSEGAFVAPIAANRSSDVAFLITVGAVATTPAAQTAWGYGTYLGHAGVEGSLTGVLQRTAMRAAIGAGLFPEANFDPIPHWEQVRQPVLAEWGQLDRDSVPGLSSKQIGAALDRGGNPCHATRIVADANHNVHRTAADGYDRLDERFPDYAGPETAWLADPCHADAGPSAPLVAEPALPTIPSPAWYDNGWVQLGMLVVLLAAYLVGGRRRLPRLARWAAVVGPVMVLGSLGYLMFLLAVAAKVTGPVLLGRPLPWLVLQLLAVATTVTTGAVVAAWRHAARLTTYDRVRLGLLTLAGVLTALWTVRWSLLVP